ncbi:MAG: hypothetical protein RIB63_16155 [Fulvivirga sp.]
MNRLFHFIAALSLLSCNNQLLVPLSFNPKIDTEPISVIEADSLLLLVEHIEEKNNLLVFDVEIQNNSSQDIQIVTDQFYDVAGFKNNQVEGEDVNSEASLISAVDEQRFNIALPKQQVIAHYDKKQKDNTAALVLLFVFGAGLLINDAVKDAQDFSYLEWTSADESRSAMRDVGVDLGLLAINAIGSSVAANSHVLSDHQYYVDNEILQSQILKAGDVTRGKVHFKTEEAFKYHMLVLPINGINYLCTFRKRKELDRQRLYYYDRKNAW